ncbi:replication gene A protein [Vibrio orientalis CIP 102891 = ATCC 33934]|uniref:Phage replication protein n=1 Tax=Vibrio orientalis CIP 102891 = ATCC 33934 TaxID=675816 RepID=C9QE99_VIBOR|nr:replication endonuclease [Vibrio orientalis]EEX94372.1 phage replication protein [Vibrio orientalis CIP 102891 = ATCC 33934]EGU54082.1 replication gene A protein [Vibrio orientalis CIP 102891 = ATCC 33934]
MKSLSYYQPLAPLKFKWRTPLVALDEKDACVEPSYRPRVQVEPDDLSVIERRLYEANPRDFEWISSKIKDLPDYLTKYFVGRYVDLLEKDGYQQANSFLRTKVAPSSERALMVLKQYKSLPTTQKVALLSKELGEDEDSFHPAFFTEHRNPDYLQQGQTSFDFKDVESKRKPIKSRLLAELDKSELKEMAFKLSVIVVKYQTKLTEHTDCNTPEGEEIAALMTYRQTAELIEGFGIKPPGAGKKLKPENIFQYISKTRCEKWWFRCLSKARKVMREHLAIAMGQVSSKASPYASWDCVREHKEQQHRNWQAIQNMMLFDEETEEQTELKDMVLKSVSNPAIRRHELMTRCRGCENIGNELGLQGLFLTLTTPSKYHNSYKKGGFIDHWNGASPRDAQTYLNNVWQRIRAKLGRLGLRWFGVRVAEPHHDGTPHWHLLIWVKPQDVLRITNIFIQYAVMEDVAELLPKQTWPKVGPANFVQPLLDNPFKVYKKVYENNFPIKPVTRRPEVELPDSVQVWPVKQQGLTTHNLDYTPRCDVGFIDPEQGTATGYIAKYISKNIDGYAMDEEISDETGKSVKDMAKNVGAWKSRWNIRQFQFFGGAPVTTYRELRRFANQNKKAFMEYLFMQERVDLLTIYSMLQRDLVGPIKPSKLITNSELMKVIGDSYQARGDSKQSRIAGTLAAADHGNWQGYIMGQGGPFVKRDDLLIVNSYQVLPFASPHGEDVRKIEGFTTPEETIKTRTKIWTIIKKSKVNEDAEARALALSGASGSSRSSVNNCTEPERVQVCDQLTRLLEPVKKRVSKSPNIDEAALAALLKGSSIRIDDDTSIQIRPAEVDEHGNKRPAQLVEVSRQRSEDTSWMDFEGWDNLFAQPEEQEYQQPDLSIFPSGDDWPLV